MSDPSLLLLVAGRISVDMTDDIADRLITAKNNGVPCANIMINSSGGDVEGNLTLYQTIRNLDFPISTYNLGSVDSMAVILYLAADLDFRYAVPGSSFRIHSVSFPVPFGEVNLNQAEHVLSEVKRLNNSVAAIIKDRTEFTDKILQHHFQSELVTTSESARDDYKMVGHIEPLQVPYASTLIRM